MSNVKIGFAVLAIVISPAVASNRGNAQERRATPAATQPSRAEPDVPGHITRPLVLLTHKVVQEDLKLTREQLNKLPEFRLNVYRKSQFPNIPREDVEVSQLAHRQVYDAIHAELKKFLTAEQYSRLGQITLQVDAADAWGLVAVFRRTEIVNELNLSEPQKELIANIRKEIQTSILELNRGGREEGEKRRAELRKSNDERLVQMLTDAQKAKWKEMIGAELSGKIDLRDLRGR